MNVSRQPFADLPASAAIHFNLYFYGAVLHLLEHTARMSESRAAMLAQFPFLAGYEEELAARGVDERREGAGAAWWQKAIQAWEALVAGHLPLRALRDEAGLDHAAIILLLTLGLTEEDARFGLVFESLQGLPGQQRPTMSLLTTWWQDAADPGAARAAVRQLLALGLVQVLNPDAPRNEWLLQPPALVWDALRGEAPTLPGAWVRYQPPATLIPIGDLIVPEPIRQAVATIPQLLAAGEIQALIVRGPQHNGRRTLLGAVARALGRGMLEVNGLTNPADERWRLVGPLATLLHAVPAVVFDPAPGETAQLPALPGYGGPLGLLLGRQGGVSAPGAARAITITLPLPDRAARRHHWQVSCPDPLPEALDEISERFRLTSGNIRRAADLAQAYAALAGHAAITPGDVQQASRALHRQALDTLAVHLPVSGDWSQLAVEPETLRQLTLLESRCRHRERLPAAVGGPFGAQLSVGVRALFSGPSGTGKTLAAQVLAAVLHMDLYRLDLAAVVNKYIGETEKNLNQVFARAEELDVILLLDEGDALLTQRTNVQSSNDRYANLETNYLLQRLEAFEGILIVTTNAGQRIDEAFQRRMDVVVTFRPPDMAERWAIWQLHLPAGHAIHPSLLEEVVRRCAFNGGQIRNIALHTALLALEDGTLVTTAHLEAAVQREYRKIGTVCPLRPAPVAGFSWGAMS